MVFQDELVAHISSGGRLMLNHIVLQSASSFGQLATPSVTATLSEMGGGGFAGAIIGYGIKKILRMITKIVAVVLALFSLGIAYLDWQGIISINWPALNAWLTTGGEWIANTFLALIPSTQSILGTLPLSASVVTGFILGFNRG
jgi:uncharacterized membrane protein (Fun14 family)